MSAVVRCCQLLSVVVSCCLTETSAKSLEEKEVVGALAPGPALMTRHDKHMTSKDKHMTSTGKHRQAHNKHRQNVTSKREAGVPFDKQ